MTGLWTSISLAEDVATAGSGAANAAYFLRRSSAVRGPRRLAALLLGLLFGAIAIEAAAQPLIGSGGAMAAALGAPLLAANLAVTAVVTAGPGR